MIMFFNNLFQKQGHGQCWGAAGAWRWRSAEGFVRGGRGGKRDWYMKPPSLFPTFFWNLNFIFKICENRKLPNRAIKYLYFPHKMQYTTKLTLPYWIFTTSRNVWGRLGYLVFSTCIRASALSIRTSFFSSSNIRLVLKDHDFRTWHLPPSCSVTLSFHANIAASNLLIVSIALCVDFKLRALSISSADFDSALKIL